MIGSPGKSSGKGTVNLMDIDLLMDDAFIVDKAKILGDSYAVYTQN